MVTAEIYIPTCSSGISTARAVTPNQYNDDAGDGVTLADTAFQQALNSNRPIYLPKGQVYLLSSVAAPIFAYIFGEGEIKQAQDFVVSNLTGSGTSASFTYSSLTGKTITTGTRIQINGALSDLAYCGNFSATVSGNLVSYTTKVAITDTNPTGTAYCSTGNVITVNSGLKIRGNIKWNRNKQGNNGIYGDAVDGWDIEAVEVYNGATPEEAGTTLGAWGVKQYTYTTFKTQNATSCGYTNIRTEDEPMTISSITPNGVSVNGIYGKRIKTNLVLNYGGGYDAANYISNYTLINDPDNTYHRGAIAFQGWGGNAADVTKVGIYDPTDTGEGFGIYNTHTDNCKQIGGQGGSMITRGVGCSQKRITGKRIWDIVMDFEGGYNNYGAYVDADDCPAFGLFFNEKGTTIENVNLRISGDYEVSNAFKIVCNNDNIRKVEDCTVRGLNLINNGSTIVDARIDRNTTNLTIEGKAHNINFPMADLNYGGLKFSVDLHYTFELAADEIPFNIEKPSLRTDGINRVDLYNMKITSDVAQPNSWAIRASREDDIFHTILPFHLTNVKIDDNFTNAITMDFNTTETAGIKPIGYAILDGVYTSGTVQGTSGVNAVYTDVNLRNYLGDSTNTITLI